mgnify:CR=1 FL=1
MRLGPLEISLAKPQSLTKSQTKAAAGPSAFFQAMTRFFARPIVSTYDIDRVRYGPRAGEKISFAVLRELSQTYDIARLCIETRQAELRSLDFKIVAKREGESPKYKDEIKRIAKFFEKPDKVNTFDSWLNALIDDWLAIDALSIYRRKDRAGRLYALEALDGATIEPLLDEYGRIPDPPNPAYRQWIRGAPAGNFSRDRILYRPYRVRTFTPYGYPPLEWLLTHAIVDMKNQWLLIMTLHEGNVPEGFGSLPEGWTPEQIEAWDTFWQTYTAGDPATRRRIKWVPAGFDFKQWREPKVDIDFLVFLVTKTCAAYSVQPQEIGFTYHINRSTGEKQEDVTYRRSIKPSADYLESIFNEIIWEDFNAPELKFKFIGVEDKEDQLNEARRWEILINNALVSPDELRDSQLGLPIDPNRPVGRLFKTSMGPIFVDEIQAEARGRNELEEQEDTPRLITPKDIRGEMRRLRTAAVNRIREKKPMKAFKSDILPPDMLEELNEKLVHVTDIEEAKSLLNEFERKVGEVVGSLRPRYMGRIQQG